MRQLSQIHPLTLFIVICFTILSGCSSIRYYHQAAVGHLSLMMSTEPVEDWLASPQTPALLKSKLELAQRARQFAATELHLPVNGAFSEYTELERPWVLVNLVAVPEFSLEPNQWCYPIIGCQAYRGYYDLDDARAEAKLFSQKGYDIFIGGVTAYSTLGWFDDPLHTGFTRLTDARMVALMFHELAHRVVYIPEDTAFNESFATTVELEGLRAWLQQRSDTTGFEQALQRLRRRNQTLELVQKTTRDLSQLYNSSGELATNQLRLEKEVIFKRLEQDYLALSQSWDGPGPFGSDPGSLNNANLALFRQYNQYVPSFQQLFRESGGQFNAFYGAVTDLSRLDADQRKTRLAKLGQRFDENL